MQPHYCSPGRTTCLPVKAPPPSWPYRGKKHIVNKMKHLIFHQSQLTVSIANTLTQFPSGFEIRPLWFDHKWTASAQVEPRTRHIEGTAEMGSLRRDRSQCHINVFWLLHLCVYWTIFKRLSMHTVHRLKEEQLKWFLGGVLAPSPIILLYWENCLETN